MENTHYKFKNVKALLAEDFLINQETTRKLLETMGISVDTTEEGDEAISMANENHYDIIFLDIQLPNKNGYEIAQTIRSNSLNKEAPIIALSANVESEDHKKGFNAGMNDYIDKPLSSQKLEEMLLKYLEDKIVA